MKRSVLMVVSLLLFSVGTASAAARKVSIPRNRKVISEPQQKAQIARFINKAEGRTTKATRLSFAQRNGVLGDFLTTGGSERNWQTFPMLPMNGSQAPESQIWQPPGGNFGGPTA